MYTCIWTTLGAAQIKRDDGAFIPRDNRNSDYAAFNSWLAAQGLTFEAWTAQYPKPVPDQKAPIKEALSLTDSGVIRGVDDVFTILVNKGILKPEDVPADLKAKLDEREALRAQLTAVAPAVEK